MSEVLGRCEGQVRANKSDRMMLLLKGVVVRSVPRSQCDNCSLRSGNFLDGTETRAMAGRAAIRR